MTSQPLPSNSNLLAHIRATISLSYPVVIGQLGTILMGVIDSLMIGHLGPNHLSASALGNSIFYIVIIIGMGITYVISPLVAEAEAAQDTEKCGRYLRQGVWVCIISSTILALIIWVGAELLPFMGQPQEDVNLAMSYTKILAISSFPTIFFLLYKHFADGLSITKPAMVITIIGLGFNTLSNWVFIYGNWGFPRMELDGAGYATILSRAIMFLLMMGYVIYQPKFRVYNPLMKWREFHWPTIKKIFNVGIPSGFQYFFEVGAFSSAVIMAGWIGINERAAHQIVLNLASITYMVTTGIAAGASIRVGNALGRKNYRDIRMAGLAGIYLAAAFMTAAALTFIVGRYYFPTLYMNDPEVLQIAAGLMVISSLFQLFDGIQAVAIGVLRGMQDVKIPTLINFIAYWVFLIPFGYFTAIHLGWGINGLWYAFILGLGLTSFLLTYRFLRLTGKELSVKSKVKL